jgi:iron complex transport system ATP-binding protein
MKQPQPHPQECVHPDCVLSAHRLSIGYAAAQPLYRDLSFSLHRGELTCLLGANGAGKSTLLRTLSAAQPALAGELRLFGKSLTAYTHRERSRLVGVVLTDKIQAGGLTVQELVALGRQPHTGFFGRLHPHDKQLTREAIAAVGISHKARAYTAELSDGERQKALIAKTLVQECPVILLDEPTAFLDISSRIEMLQLLRRLAVEQQKAILLSTHDIEQALILSDRLWLLSPQEGLRCGDTQTLILNGTLDALLDKAAIEVHKEAEDIILCRRRKNER